MMEKRSKRRNYFISKGFQLKFILLFSVVLLVISFLMVVLLLFFTKDSATVVVENARINIKRTIDFLFPLLIQTVGITTILGAISVAIVSLFVSHRIAGPLYRIKKELELISQGVLTPNFRIRRTDQLQDLSRALSQMAEALRSKHNSLKKKHLEIKDTLRRADLAQLEKRIEELDKIISYFKL